ncbi:SAM-dependent methyltransferase [Candidatus Terasakiella magnetica]|nr:SAM-dependent methyltransferase [Candidatus Terasakiella magnetica]
MADLRYHLPPTIGYSECRYGPMVYPAGDVYVGRSLLLYGEYSDGETQLFRQFVRPGDTVVEAGANIGALTIPLGRLVGPKGRVLAFEAQRSIHAILSTNLVINGLEHVWAERVALGGGPGEITVPHLPLDRLSNFGGVSLGGEGGEPCPVRSLDSYAIEKLRLIKIDVEGAEYAVIAGAVDTIKRLRPILYVENDRREKSAALIGAILGLGYRLWWHLVPLYSPNNFRKVGDNVFGPVGSKNMVCMPVEWGVKMTGGIEITSPDAPHPF